MGKKTLRRGATKSEHETKKEIVLKVNTDCCEKVA